MDARSPYFGLSHVTDLSKPKPKPMSQTNKIQSYFDALSNQARTENLKREKEVRGIYTDLISKYSKDSPFYKSGMADIATGAANLEGTGIQNLISGGLFGTTNTLPVARQVADFKQQGRLRLEDVLETKKSEAQLGYANFIERIQNPYPDYNALIQAYAG